MEKLQKLALGSICVGAVVLALKYAAYHVTGSIALYSDALESIINVITAATAFLAIRVSAAPPDSNHPYGHHKAEYFSAVLEGVLIILAALSILRQAYAGFMDPQTITAPLEGLAINALSSLLNAGWSWMLIRQGKSLKSPALIADGRHLLADVTTSIGVIIGIGLVMATGWAVLDSVLAALVAISILWSGWGLIKESLSGLMDEAVPEAVLDQVRKTIAAHADGAIEAHDLRTRQAGKMTFIDFHLVVSGSMSVTDAHDICDRLERALLAQVEEAMITIHVEPDDKAKHAGIVVL